MDAPATPLWAVAILGAGIALRLGVGGWVLLRAIRLRALPELMIGANLFFLAASELGFVLATRLRADWSSPSVAALALVSLLSLAIAQIMMAEGLRRLFRPDSGWARLAVVALVATLLAAVWLRLSQQNPSVVLTGASPAQWGLISVVIMIDLWWGGESLRLGQRLRRRAALGISGAESAVRFYLWAVAAFSHALLSSCLLLCALVLRRPAAELPWLLAALGAASVVSALAIQASFHTPRFLLKRVPSAEPGIHNAEEA